MYTGLEFFRWFSGGTGGEEVIHFWGMYNDLIRLHSVGWTELYYIGEIMLGFFCLIILTSVHWSGGLRINYTPGMRRNQDADPRVSYAYICAFYVFFLFSHHSSLYANKYWSNYSEKKICVKMNGADSSLNVEKTITFQGKMVVCGSA